MKNLTTKSKLRAVIVIAVVLLMVAYFVLVMAVMSADAANNTGARLQVVTPATDGRGPEPTPVPTEKEQRTRQDTQPEPDLEGCTAGEHWIRIADYLDPETILESWGEGWVLFQNKCGEFYLIPITEPSPYPEPYPYPYPEP